MKGGKKQRKLRGRCLYLAVLILISATVMFWDQEPFSESPLSSPDDPSESLNSEAHLEVENFQSTETEETNDLEENDIDAPTLNSTSSFPPDSEDSDGDTPFSSEEEEISVHTLDDSSISETPEEHIEEHTSQSITTEEANSSEENFVSTHSDGDETYSSGGEVCNYAKGKWVADSRQPFYSGSQCNRWLLKEWACRLGQRADFAYERYRWQPKDCSMPEFERSAFLKKMQDKTIAFIGDSMGRQQFESLMCMATGGEESPEVKDVGWDYDLVKRPGAIRPHGWAYRFPDTNTTILFYWSTNLCSLELLNITDPDSNIAMHLDRPLRFLRRFIHRFDVLVLNTGHHWNREKEGRNHWVLYVNGKRNKDARLEEIRSARNFTVHSITKWLDSRLASYPRLKVFFRTISPRHYSYGDWKTMGVCNNTTPLTRGSEVSQDESTDVVVESAVKGTTINILDITALSDLRDEAHRARHFANSYDCLHWCLPGVPDTWNEILVAQV